MIYTIVFLFLSATQFNISGNVDMVKDNHITRPITVKISGRITESSAKKFASDMDAAQETGQPVIPVIIRSYGGNVYSLLSMIDVIRNSKVPVATIVVGKAMSAGAVLLSCGADGMRYMAPNATIMIHEVSSSMHGKIIGVKADVNEALRLNRLILGIMSLNIGKNKKYIASIIHLKGHADWYLTAREAKKYGLVNHIGVPEFVVDITVKTKLE